ncbi:hypothetical protein GGG16DRAFT_118415 [Schizophyllum commune]
MKLCLVVVVSVVASLALATPIHAFARTELRRSKAKEEWYMTVCGWAYEDPTLESAQPTVVIVGGGHSGLNVAARLKALGVNSLILEKNSRVGDNWRGRYESLVLHDPVWYDHLPYLPFPSTWPVHTRAPKLGDWLESYATSLDLDVLTSTPVVRATNDEKTGSWTVVARRSSDGKERTFNVKHVVLAVGLGEGWSKIP